MPWLRETPALRLAALYTGLPRPRMAAGALAFLLCLAPRHITGLSLGKAKHARFPAPVPKLAAVSRSSRSRPASDFAASEQATDGFEEAGLENFQGNFDDSAFEELDWPVRQRPMKVDPNAEPPAPLDDISEVWEHHTSGRSIHSVKVHPRELDDPDDERPAQTTIDELLENMTSLEERAAPYKVQLAPWVLDNRAPENHTAQPEAPAAEQHSSSPAAFPTDPIRAIEMLNLAMPLNWVYVPKSGGSLANSLIRLPDICQDMPIDALVDDKQPASFLESFQKQHSLTSKCPEAFSSNYGVQNDMESKYESLYKRHSIIMLRQPEQRIVASYNDNQQNWPFRRQADTLLEYAEVMQGCMVRMLTRDGGPSVCGSRKQATQAEVETATERLKDGFVYVGLVEEWDLSVCLLHQMFGGKCYGLEFVNAPTSVVNVNGSWPEQIHNVSLASVALAQRVHVATHAERQQEQEHHSWPWGRRKKNEGRRRLSVLSWGANRPGHPHWNGPAQMDTEAYDTTEMGGFRDLYDGPLYDAGRHLFQKNLQLYGVSLHSCLPCFENAQQHYADSGQEDEPLIIASGIPAGYPR